MSLYTAKDAWSSLWDTAETTPARQHEQFNQSLRLVDFAAHQPACGHRGPTAFHEHPQACERR
jgi:hypothetical protein